MFERFTAKARRVVVLAQEEARFLNHNYIGTEHILLGLVHEGSGIGGRALAGAGLTLEGTRQEVEAVVARGTKEPKGHIPFTPRAKKTLELALREALTLHHNYIGTEHILLGLIREGEGVAAGILREHSDLMSLRSAVLDLAPADTSAPQSPRARSWLRRVVTARPFAAGAALSLAESAELGEAEEQPLLNATPAADVTLSTAARFAGGEPVGSHHLLLAALTDANSAAAKVLASLGVDLARAKDALLDVDVAGTSDEPPEEAGRRRLAIQVSGELVTIVAADQVLVSAANAALKAVRQAQGPDAAPGDTIRGAELSGLPAKHLAKAWELLAESMSALADSGQAAAQQAATARAAAEAKAEDKPAAEAEAKAEDKATAETGDTAEAADEPQAGAGEGPSAEAS